MYHVAPVTARGSIQQYGLDATRRSASPWDGHGLDIEDGTYLWEDGEDAEEYVHTISLTSDIWEVDISGVLIQPDPEGGDPESWFTTQPIPPTQLRLVDTVEPQDWEDRYGHSLDEYIAAAILPEVRFSFEHYAALVHRSNWTEVAEKAKRLIQEGRVTIIRNTPTHIMAHVIGDGTDNGGTPDEHDVEITRQLDANGEPTSSALEQANCTCKWWQFSFDRTRKWKKYEQRACSHILATFWKAKSTPLDTSEMGEGYQTPRGQRGPAPPPTGPVQEQLKGMPLPQHLQPDTDQRSFDPNEPGMPSPGPEASPLPGPAQLPSTQQLAIPKAPESPFSTPKTPPIPQHEQLELFDITAQPGQQPGPTPPTVSVPGGRPPTPGGPVQFPGTFSHFIPVLALHTGSFIYASDALTEYFEAQRAANQPIHVALTNMVALERSGGKIPVPGAQPHSISSEGIPMYAVTDLGWNPDTNSREKADVNVLQGAPEETGTYSDVGPGRYAEVIDYEPSLKMVYIAVPLNYPDGVDARLHPHMLKGWVGYSDVRPVQPSQSPFRKKRF